MLSGVGGLDKLGTNTLTLAANNTYGGPTSITGGNAGAGKAVNDYIDPKLPDVAGAMEALRASRQVIAPDGGEW